MLDVNRRLFHIIFIQYTLSLKTRELVKTGVHSKLELSGRCALQIYLLTYLQERKLWKKTVALDANNDEYKTDYFNVGALSKCLR